MIPSPALAPDTFLFSLVPAPDRSASELMAGLRAQIASFGLPARAYLDPALFSHRILRAKDGSLSWEISFHGLDLPGEGQAPRESLEDSLFEEVSARLRGLGDLGGSASFTDLSSPPPSPGFRRISILEGPPLPGEDGSDWLPYAADSGAAEAGTIVSSPILEGITGYRSGVPVEAGLRPYGAGHMYTGSADKAHVKHLSSYLAARAGRASAADARKIRAFAAFQAREGSTAAINTYDNQIVTWGTGWGGLGSLGKVMERATAHELVRNRFGSAGLAYRKNSVYDVVDAGTGKVVTGKAPALELVRRSLPLLYLLIDVARAPATRDAILEAQLQTFMEGSGNLPGAEAIATQALFNLVAHLKHWAPGYVTGCLEWAVPQLGDPVPSADRDRALAVLVGRYFYGRARKYAWIPSWKQFQLYFQHMKSDGLDCMGDPFIQAPSYPAEDPFVAHPITPNKPPPVTPPPVTPPPTHPPLAGQPDLQRIARGEASLRRKAKGAAVKAVQQALMRLGFPLQGGDDGDFGPRLEKAVKAFQAQRGLGVDGVVGKDTLLAMDAQLAGIG